MEIKKVAVLGGGQMGRQIALHSAISSFEVCITDVVPAVLQNVREWEEEYLNGRIQKGKMTKEQVGDIRKRFHVVDSMEEAVKDADLVIEAVLEREDIKHDVFQKLGKMTRSDCILATNSSHMVSSMFKDDVPNPARLCNIHYFNPALVMQLIEIVRGEHTSDETVALARDFAVKSNKMPVVVQKEIDGFIVNNIVKAVQDEAFRLVEGGYCTFEEVDIACEKGLNYPMGPFRLRDLMGIDLGYDIAKRRYEESGEKPLGYDTMKKLYEEGRLGKKSGHGFYDYE